MATGNDISQKIANIAENRRQIRDWLINIGEANNNSKLEDCATAITQIPIYKNQYNMNLPEGDSYTIPKGYHDGTQSIINVSEESAGRYELYELNPITPSENQQTFSIPDGYYGYSSFKVEAIPDRYADITDVTATQNVVLVGSFFVDSNGVLRQGQMPNNGAVSDAIIVGMSSGNSTYTIPEGYHNGEGVVRLSDDIERALADI